MGVKEQAQGRWPGILSSLGVAPEYLRNVHGPCPMCGGSDRYRFDDKGGRGTFYCNSCGAGTGLDLLMLVRGWDFKTAAREVEKVIGAVPEASPTRKRDPTPALNAVYKGSRPIEQGDEAHHYLMRRGLSVLPLGLRTHPGLTIFGAEYPCMLGVLLDVNGEAVSIHRTYLQDGAKAPIDDPKRLMPGKRNIMGSAIRLWPAGDTVGLAEGIETAAAAAQMFNVPTWSCVSAQGLERVELPAGIRRVLIFGDNDSSKSFEGERAAYALASRLTREGRSVEVHIPPLPGDWLDALPVHRPPLRPAHLGGSSS